MSGDRASALGVLALVILVGALLATTLDRVGSRGPDEAHYLTYMSLVEQQGTGAYRSLFTDYVGDEQRWLFPNPLRLGYITLTGITAKVAGASFETLSLISLVAHLLCIVAGYAFARRVLGNPRAAYVAALLAFSPLWMALARRALADTLATLAAVLAIWAFWEALRARGGWRWHALLAASFAFGMLVKETSVLLAIPFGAVLTFEVFARGRRDALLPIGIALAAPMAFCGVLWWIAAGDLGVLIELVGIILGSPSNNEYAARYGGGPWTRYLLDFLLLSPGPTLLAIAACGVVVVRERRVDPVVAYLTALSACVLLSYEPFTKNVRYVAVLELPIRMLAVWLVWEVLHPRGARLAALGCGLLVALLVWADYTSFRLIFLDGGLYDPVTVPLLGFRGVLPPG